uniref:Uncharacterized protein n=1 Tax=Pipistrellus kuhlii TaxID=59472 RepID=A0A7J7XAQ9_PIPKU|nr:hypothetical protein mPipKuh1_010583 [Pipistrellus kuhlii]
MENTGTVYFYKYRKEMQPLFLLSQSESLKLKDYRNGVDSHMCHLKSCGRAKQENIKKSLYSEETPILILPAKIHISEAECCYNPAVTLGFLLMSKMFYSNLILHFDHDNGWLSVILNPCGYCSFVPVEKDNDSLVEQLIRLGLSLNSI